MQLATEESLANTNGTSATTLQDSKLIINYKVKKYPELEALCDQENVLTDSSVVIIEEQDTQVDAQELTPLESLKTDSIMATPLNKNMCKITERKVPKRKLISTKESDRVPKSRKDCEYVSDMLSHSKKLKEEEHKRRMEMEEEENSIKMAIHREKLQCATLEREILELRKAREIKLVDL